MPARTRRRRPWIAAALAVLAAAGAAAAVVLTGDEGADGPQPAEPAIAGWRWAPVAETARPAAATEVAAETGGHLVQPRAGGETAATPLDQTPEQHSGASAAPAEREPRPVAPDIPPAPDPEGELARAEVLENGIALPPLSAPPQVEAIIEAGNNIARHPYKWGGGHGRWQDNGYDCSGSVSFALAAAGLLDRSLDSSRLMKWGKPGPGRWVTVWSNPGHVFLEVAGVRFDTSGRRRTGSRWQDTMRPTGGYVARHPQGL